MASERDERQNELDKRRQQRKERAAQREKQKKARRTLLVRLGGVAVVIAAVAALMVWVKDNAQNQATDPGIQLASSQDGDTAPATQPKTTKPKDKKQEPTTVIHIAAAGDLNVTDQVLKNNTDGNTYDFTNAFMDVAPVLTGADLTVLNFEGTLAGTPYGADRSSAPQQLAENLASIGVDAVQTANSASVRAGVLGLQATIDGFYSAGIVPVGTFSGKETFRKTGGYSIMDVNGIKVALVGFTKGMDNLGLPEGSEDCVNLLYKDYTTDYQKVDRDSINKVLSKVADEKPDLTIAMLHWGSENNEDVSSSQKEIRDLLLANGVDIILGTHPHVVQTVDYNTENGTLVAYSLGDFYGDATQAGTNYSIVLDIEVTRDNTTGETKVTGYDYTPIFTILPEQSLDGGHRVVRLNEAISRYEGNYLGKVSKEVYDSMKYAQERLTERVTKEIED